MLEHIVIGCTVCVLEHIVIGCTVCMLEHFFFYWLLEYCSGGPSTYMHCLCIKAHSFFCWRTVVAVGVRTYSLLERRSILVATVGLLH